MKYIGPEVEVVGSASEKVQLIFGPWIDGGASAFSWGAPADEEEE